MTGLTEKMGVGLVCLLVILPWIGWTVRRGLANQRLPIGRGYVERAERPGAFRALLGFYIAAVAIIAFTALDLLFGIRG